GELVLPPQEVGVRRRPLEVLLLVEEPAADPEPVARVPGMDAVGTEMDLDHENLFRRGAPREAADPAPAAEGLDAPARSGGVRAGRCHPSRGRTPAMRSTRAIPCVDSEVSSPEFERVTRGMTSRRLEAVTGSPSARESYSRNRR